MKLLKKIKYFGLLATIALALATACSTTTIDNSSAPEAQYAEGERLLKKGRYLEAAERFRILKNRYPYSVYAVLATLKVGDVYYEQETFLEAASAYKVFLELYPKHEKADYALFQVGKSYAMLVPDTVDRDQSSADAAIRAFSELERKYKSSSYLEEATKLKSKLLKGLAGQEMYVANFYFVRDMYPSAVGRYRNVLDTFSGTGFNKIALQNLAVSYAKLGKRTLAMEIFDRYQLEFPDTDHDRLRKKIETALANPVALKDKD